MRLMKVILSEISQEDNKALQFFVKEYKVERILEKWFSLRDLLNLGSLERWQLRVIRGCLLDTKVVRLN